jgi:Spy/CpxP family protein refolding chaperone
MNKTLNRLVVVCGLLLVGGSLNLARAQSGSPGSGQDSASPQQQTERGRPDLNLTGDQKAQMKKIHEGAKAQIEVVKNDSSLSADQKQGKIQQIHQGTHKQIEAVLTPEQKKTMREWRRAHRGSRQQQAPPPSN